MSDFIQVKNKIESSSLLKVSPFRKEIRKTEPHKHNSYFELIYLSKGTGTHTIDHSTYNIQPPVIFLVRKEQVHHWDLSSEPDGFVIILKKGFLDQSLDSELKALLIKLSAHACMQVQDSVFIEQVFQLLASETNFHIQEGLLKALFAKVSEVSLPVYQKVNKSVDLVTTFRELLSQKTGIKNNVAHYATLLHTSPQNLNAICRKATNQAASELLAEYIIAEAKRLLLYTNNSVAEIANSLDFSDGSHFVKYFKRYTTQTPSAFRKL
ncbi:AraC family transcriptional regulator [Taibaiella soli]|uniref:AraC family transcriptional regulator n=1 Tax=Taibaiella soli TaxID=1649169 RepID=A0A2W2B8E7_9BACT|nr:helix-turn-helix transcriptional regulator [Taibaiella soli]PZF72559.1 AraC family transcriptional regulator [Taibaiella soli]